MVKSWLGMALPIVMVIGFYVLLTYVDIIILQQFRPPEDVALYHAATKTLTLVTFVYFSVSAATAHRFSEYQTAGDRTACKRSSAGDPVDVLAVVGGHRAGAHVRAIPAVAVRPRLLMPIR